MYVASWLEATVVGLLPSEYRGETNGQVLGISCRYNMVQGLAMHWTRSIVAIGKLLTSSVTPRL